MTALLRERPALEVAHVLRDSGAAFLDRYGGGLSAVQRLYATDWVVYSKPPFGGPAQVLKYLARSTHRVAISNARLESLEDGRVTFRTKDYADGGRSTRLTLDAEEFLRRFVPHVLPRGSSRYGTTACWPIASVRPGWPYAGVCCGSRRWRPPCPARTCYRLSRRSRGAVRSVVVRGWSTRSSGRASRRRPAPWRGPIVRKGSPAGASTTLPRAR